MCSRPSIKYCAVPKCSNSSIKTEHKFFFSSPENLIRRKRWLKAMDIGPMYYSERTRFFVCEDHFDLSNDLRNYSKFKHGKDIFKQHKLKLDAVPRIFNHKKNELKNTVEEVPAQKAPSAQAINSITEEVNPLEENPLKTELHSSEEKCFQTELLIKLEKEDMKTEEVHFPTEPLVKLENSDTAIDSKGPTNFFEITLRCDGDITCTCDTGPCDRVQTHDKAVQCYFTPLKPKIRSRGIQTSNKYYSRDVALSPIRFDDIDDEESDI